MCKNFIIKHLTHSLKINSEASWQLRDKEVRFMNVKQFTISCCLEIMKFCRAFLRLKKSVSAMKVFVESSANFQNCYFAGQLFIAISVMFGWCYLQDLHCMRPHWEICVSVIPQQVKYSWLLGSLGIFFLNKNSPTLTFHKS